MKRPTTLPTLEGTKQHLGAVGRAICLVIAIALVALLLSPWSN